MSMTIDGGKRKKRDEKGRKGKKRDSGCWGGFIFVAEK